MERINHRDMATYSSTSMDLIDTKALANDSEAQAIVAANLAHDPNTGDLSEAQIAAAEAWARDNNMELILIEGGRAGIRATPLQPESNLISKLQELANNINGLLVEVGGVKRIVGSIDAAKSANSVEVYTNGEPTRIDWNADFDNDSKWERVSAPYRQQ